MRNFTIYRLLTLILIGTSNLACSVQPNATAPYYGKNIPVHDFLEKPMLLNSPESIVKLQQATWESHFAYELINKQSIKRSVSNCSDLVSSLDEGYEAMTYRKKESVQARRLSCNVLQEIAKFSSYSTTYFNDLKLDKGFATIAPADFAMIISKDDERKAKTAANWEAMSEIQKIEKRSSEETIFYDNSGGMQRVSLLAKGDYNGDDIEDIVLHVQNNVIEGSYSSVHAFIITRLEKEGMIKIIKKIQ